jgi:hypothetical protein
VRFIRPSFQIPEKTASVDQAAHMNTHDPRILYLKLPLPTKEIAVTIDEND